MIRATPGNIYLDTKLLLVVLNMIDIAQTKLAVLNALTLSE